MIRMNKWPLFWCLSPESQANLMIAYYEITGTVLKPPLPPDTSKAIWEATLNENHEDFDKLMRQAPEHQKRIE